jgi:hypothetical protein
MKLDKIEKIFLLFLIITYLVVIFNLGYSSGYNDGILEATITNTKVFKAWSKDRIQEGVLILKEKK